LAEDLGGRQNRPLQLKNSPGMENAQMATRTFVMAALGLSAVAVPALAHPPAPLVPVALVEDVKSTGADIEFMDYVGIGQVIKLGAGDVLVLSYLKSCEYETITGGTVTVGMERSNVQGGQIVRSKVPCDGGKIRLSSQQASQSGASAFRLQSAKIRPVLFARAPVVQLPADLAGDQRTLLIERTDRPGERHQFTIDAKLAAGNFYDLGKLDARLVRGAVYTASLGGHQLTFKIDAKARSGPAPVVSRLLRFQ
jgi:hypothetical protein